MTTPTLGTHWQEHHECALAELAALRKWKEAVINELIVAHIYSQTHDDSPRKAVHDAITWNCQVALDPAVSSDAQKLRDTYLQRAEAAERDAFTMAAGQCIVKSGGLMGDDHGHQYCDMERQRDEWKRKAEEAERDAARYRLIVKDCLILDNDCTQGCYSVKSGITDKFVRKPGGDFRWDSYDAALDAIAAKGEA